MRVFSNTAISLDGKIATYENNHLSLGSNRDRALMGVLRDEADAVLVGGRTFRNWLRPSFGPNRRTRINAVITRQGVVAAARRSGFWPSAEVSLLVFSPPGVEDREAASQLEIRVVERTPVQIGWVLEQLDALGCQDVLVEGGGELLFELISSNLLDELYVTLTPKLVGGAAAPTLLDGGGFDRKGILDLDLLHHRREGDEIFLHYAVKKPGSGTP